MNPDLKFSANVDHQHVPFLDMCVELHNGSLITTLYQKDTDKNTVLLASSAHPRALKYGLPKSQFYRLRYLCHSDEDFTDKAAAMKKIFLERGYSVVSR